MTAASVANIVSSIELPQLFMDAVRREVERGLTAQPKALPPWLLYDSAGSQLFEEITQLPEYYLTRTERAIFAAHAEEIIRRAANGRRLEIIELGAGSAAKTGILLSAAVRQQQHITYRAIDVSPTALEEAKMRLEARFPEVDVQPTVADYTVSMDAIGTSAPESPSVPPARSGALRKLVLSIGSSIGNFDLEDAATLLANLREQLAPGDGLLLGTDMVKDSKVLLAAYNDSAGVTARFNKNVLSRINRELGGNFELSRFRHQAVWNSEMLRIEMYLKSLCCQQVSIPDLGLRISFKEGEGIHTENSYKFTHSRISGLLDGAGFMEQEHWTDMNGWFRVQLATAV